MIRHGATTWNRPPSTAWRKCPLLAGATDDAPRRGDQRSDRPSLRTRRAIAASCPSVLVPIVRRRDGNGLALVGHNHERNRRAKARAPAARGRSRNSRFRRARLAYPGRTPPAVSLRRAAVGLTAP